MAEFKPVKDTENALASEGAMGGFGATGGIALTEYVHNVYNTSPLMELGISVIAGVLGYLGRKSKEFVALMSGLIVGNVLDVGFRYAQSKGYVG